MADLFVASVNQTQCGRLKSYVASRETNHSTDRSIWAPSHQQIMMSPAMIISRLYLTHLDLAVQLNKNPHLLFFATVAFL